MNKKIQYRIPNSFNQVFTCLLGVFLVLFATLEFNRVDCENNNQYQEITQTENTVQISNFDCEDFDEDEEQNFQYIYLNTIGDSAFPVTKKVERNCIVPAPSNSQQIIPILNIALPPPVFVYC